MSPEFNRARWSWDPLAAESLNRWPRSEEHAEREAGSSAQRVRCCPPWVSRAEEPTRASAVFLPGNARRNRTGSRSGAGSRGADGLALNALCRGTPTVLPSEGNQAGRLPRWRSRGSGERVTEAAAVPGVRLTGGRPPSSPNPRKLQTVGITTHQGPGDHGAVPRAPTCPVCPGNPEDSTSRNFSFSLTLCQLQSQFLASVPKKLGLESSEMPIVGSNLWGRS